MRTGNDEIEFHLATLLVDLRAIDAMSSTMSRDIWLATVQPLLAHGVGVCLALATILDDDAARCARELAQTIASVRPPEARADAPPGSNEAAWKAIREKHGDLAQKLATRGIKAWVFGRSE